MRKCTARVWSIAIAPEKTGKWVEITGEFHQFGQQIAETRDSMATYTTAIIEDAGGQVWEAEVSSLKFLESV